MAVTFQETINTLVSRGELEKPVYLHCAGLHMVAVLYFKINEHI